MDDMKNNLDEIAKLSEEFVKLSEEFISFGERLLAQKIYFNRGERLTIPKACEKITDDAILQGECCNQTIIDLMKIVRIINKELL